MYLSHLSRQNCCYRYLSAAFRIVFLSCFFVALPHTLCCCHGGGGGGGAGSSLSEDSDNTNDPPDYLRGKQGFMPEYTTKAELYIESYSVELNLTCLRPALTGECNNGPLDGCSANRIRLKSGKVGLSSHSEISVRGIWEQRDANITNCVRGLWVYGSEEGIESDLLKELSFTIYSREDDASNTDNTIILGGTAISGTLILPDGAEYPLSGASVRLTYTIDSAHVNDTTHGTPAP